MPASARMLVVRWATAGVGTGPQSRTRPPIDVTPEAIAVSIMYPLRRVSLPIRTRGACRWPRPATKVTARPRARASSGVIGWTLAMPRMPSVPNSDRLRGQGLLFPAGRRRASTSAGSVWTTSAPVWPEAISTATGSGWDRSWSGATFT